MLSRIGSALQAAADVVAPPCARVEDLRYHWSQVAGACQRCQGPNPYTDGADNSISVADQSLQAGVLHRPCKTASNGSSNGGSVTSTISASNSSARGSQRTVKPKRVRASMVPAVEETHAPRHLGHMLRILSAEKYDGWGSLSPCLEFLVTERVLSSLASFAWCDRPLGIRQHAYIFLSGVLCHLHHSHLHHARIHKPLQSMVRASSEMVASPYEAEEMEYLTALCEKIRQDHTIVLLYIQPAVMTEGISGDVTPTDCLTYAAAPSVFSECSNAPSVFSECSDTPHASLDSASLPPSCSPTHSAPSDAERSNGTHNQLHSNSEELSDTVNKDVDDQHSERDSRTETDLKKSLVNNSIPQNSNLRSAQSSSRHSISSNHSSDSSTRCYSVSSNRFSSSSRAYTFPRASRHVGLQSSFPLVDALLNLCHSSDCGISNAAHECLVQLCAVREAVCCRTIARHTLFPYYVASKIAESVAAVPQDVDPVLIEDISLPKEKPHNYTDRAQAAATTPDISSSDSEDNESVEEGEEDFQGRRELVKMLQWLAYCDKVVCTGDAVLRTSLCHCIREIVLNGQLLTGLTSADAELVSFSMAMLSRIITSLSSHSLVMGVVRWVYSGGDTAHGGQDSGYEDEGSLLPVLLQYCREPPHQIQTLRLLQTTIEASCGGGATLLTGPWLLPRRYFDSSAAEVQQNCWSDEEDERVRQKKATKEVVSPGSQPISRTFAPSNINRIVKQFLSLVPEELRSNDSNDFCSYKSDAVRQYRDVARSSSVQRWGREARALHCWHGDSAADTASLSSRESPPEEDRLLPFSPGPFLELLLDLLEKLPQQAYDVNLQVTCAISCLALLPQPHLHEFLLNPSLPVVEGVRTPYSVLRAVVAHLQPIILAAPDATYHLKLARHQLLGATNTWEIERDDQDREFEALIVIEEFCKELASIAHAKYTVELDR